MKSRQVRGDGGACRAYRRLLNLAPAQALPLLEAKELVLLDDSPLDIDLYWQRWRLESEVLSELTRSVIEAATDLVAT